MKLFSSFLMGCALLASALAQTSTSGNASATTATQAAAPSSAGAPQASASTATAAHAGTVVPVELSKSVDSKKAKVGDEVTAKVINDVRSGGVVAISRGSKLVGKVTEANARSKGDATSTLGIVFDRAILKNGATLNLVSTIQAAIAPPETPSVPLPDSSNGGGGGTEGPEGNRGGTNAGSGSPVAAIGNTAGSAVGAVGHTADSATQTADLAANARVGANAPVVTAQTMGVVGIRGLELNAGSSANASGSVFTTSSKSVRLEGGTRLLVNVSAASKAEPAAPNSAKQDKK